MKIYLDNCCFNRPYDEQANDVIRLETEAKLIVQEAINIGRLQLVWSFMLDFENNANPFIDNRDAIARWKEKAIQLIDAQDNVRERAKQISGNGIKAKDALHLACALQARCDYFLTTDRQLIRKALSLKEIKTINPVDFLYEIEEQT